MKKERQPRPGVMKRVLFSELEGRLDECHKHIRRTGDQIILVDEENLPLGIFMDINTHNELRPYFERKLGRRKIDL